MVNSLWLFFWLPSLHLLDIFCIGWKSSGTIESLKLFKEFIMELQILAVIVQIIGVLLGVAIVGAIGYFYVMNIIYAIKALRENNFVNIRFLIRVIGIFFFFPLGIGMGFVKYESNGATEHGFIPVAPKPVKKDGFKT